MSDRTVHAVIERDDVVTEIVRYDRAGKWYVEPSGGVRTRVSIKEAVDLIRAEMDREDHVVTWRAKQPGGHAFDARLSTFFPAGVSR